MIGSLLDSIEADYGVVATRLYRAFRPKPGKSCTDLQVADCLFLIDFLELSSEIYITLEISPLLLRPVRSHFPYLCRHSFSWIGVSGNISKGGNRGSDNVSQCNNFMKVKQIGNSDIRLLL
jgi:hypothetical protein